MNKNHIEIAAQKLGSQANLARVLHVSPAMVNQWIRGIRPIAAEHCPVIERETSGEVRCEDLRPDVDWDYLRGTYKTDAKQASDTCTKSCSDCTQDSTIDSDCTIGPDTCDRNCAECPDSVVCDQRALGDRRQPEHRSIVDRREATI